MSKKKDVSKAKQDTGTGAIQLAKAQFILRLPDIIKTFIRWLLGCTALCLCVYFGASAFIECVGKETVILAKIWQNVISMSVTGKLTELFGVLFGGGGIGYGVVQRNLRRKQIKESSKRKTSLEQMIDPERSSSGIKETGETNEEDR